MNTDWITRRSIAALFATSLIIVAGGCSASDDSSAGSPQTDASPAASPTGAADASPVPTDTASPSPTDTGNGLGALNFPDFDDFNQSGTGDTVITLPSGATQGMITATYDGGDDDNFIITILDSSNNDVGDTGVDAIGAYSGVVAFGVDDASTPASIQVQAGSGNWTVLIQSLNKAPTLPGSGTGDGVFAFTGDAATWAITSDGGQDGDGFFAVTQYTTGIVGINLLVDTIGSYTGSVAADAGPALVTVNADPGSAWTISIG